MKVGKTFYAKNRLAPPADRHFMKMTARNKRFGMVQ